MGVLEYNLLGIPMLATPHELNAWTLEQSLNIAKLLRKVCIKYS